MLYIVSYGVKLIVSDRAYIFRRADFSFQAENGIFGYNVGDEFSRGDTLHSCLCQVYLFRDRFFSDCCAERALHNNLLHSPVLHTVAKYPIFRLKARVNTSNTNPRSVV